MDVLLGISGADFVILASDRMAARSIQVFKHDEDKIYQLDKYKLMGAAGPQGDRAQFCEYVQKNIALYALMNTVHLSVKATVAFTRDNLAKAIRKGPYQVNSLIGGYDVTTERSSLYYLDYMGSSHQVAFGAHGYGAFFTLGLLDRYYTPDITVEGALDLIRKCIRELQLRFLVQLPKFVCKIADKDGCRIIELGEDLDLPAPEPLEGKSA